MTPGLRDLDAAKARMQAHQHAGKVARSSVWRKPGSMLSVFGLLPRPVCESSTGLWVPAFAGMTFIG